MFLIPLCLLNWFYLSLSFLLLVFLYIFEFGWFNLFEFIGFGMGMDLLSYMMIILSIWICLVMMTSSKNILENFFGYLFSFMILLLLIFLILSFSVTNMFMFYIFFEMSLIPTFFLIVGWGYQMERMQAGMYLMMYTLLLSLPLMMMILFIYVDLNTLSFLNLKNFNFIYDWYIYILMNMAFLVKLPMFFLHLWLPSAHVEAPVSGSMILAGVLLKLGGYGLIRISLILYTSIFKFSFYFIIISLIGGVLISLNCLTQSDMKMLVAYSSVSHMGLMLGGLMTFYYWGLVSSLLMMVSHGLCSSGLFYLINVIYERVGSRNLVFIKGFIHILPKMTMWWFLFCIMNMSAPPSLNLVSELGLIFSLMGWSTYSFFFIILIGFFVGGYCLYLFSFSQHGKINIYYNFKMNYVIEYLTLYLHWFPLNLLILNCGIFSLWL